VDRLPITGSPFPFGLTFVPDDALGPVIGAVGDPPRDLAEASTALGASFAFVPGGEPWAADAVTALSEVGVAPLWVVSGPLWPVIEAHGAMEGLRETLTRPREIGAEIEGALDAVVSRAQVGAQLGARAVVVAEDLAGSEGPLVAPDFAIAELLPRYERIVRAARSLGMPAVFHSDGDIRLLLPAIARAGFVAVHAGGGLGFEAFDRLFWAARDARLAVMGGLLTGELGNAARAEAIGSTIGVLARAGGLFVADDGGITQARETAGLVTALAAARAV
jgi:uroporphyrinogen decarboxylase